MIAAIDTARTQRVDPIGLLTGATRMTLLLILFGKQTVGFASDQPETD